MAQQQEQVFTTIVLEWDDTIFSVVYTLQPDGRVATMKIRKILDTSYFVLVDKFNNGITWNGHFPAPAQINLNKGLTVMEIT